MRILITSLAALLIISVDVIPQTCDPPAPVLNSKIENIFSPEQEMFIGDAMMERLKNDYRVIEDPKINAYLQEMGDRIAKHLPPNGIRFTFVLADLPDVNAYAMPGGRIMVTRKMVSFAKNEDELAGVLGHELGHALVRHGAQNLSRYFTKILGVTSVGDRRDVFEKYNRFLELWRTKRVSFSSDHQDEQQLEADRIGLFAVYAAGYDPAARASYWKRLTEAKRVGFFDSLFGAGRPSDKRFEEMLDGLKAIPPKCLEKKVAQTVGDFEAWRIAAISHTGQALEESLNGLLVRQPLTPLRPDLEHLKFSPDGRYILAQDNSTVTILTREPLAVVFRVDVENAFPANFSQDSKTLIVSNRNLRVQKWSIADQKLIATHEVALRGGNWQTKISPDGNYLAAYRYNTDLIVLDVKTNEEIFKEKDFYLPMYWEVWLWEWAQSNDEQNEYAALNLKFSPDGKYLLAGRRNALFNLLLSGRDATIAVDLAARKKTSVGDNIKRLMSRNMDFMSPSKVIGQYDLDSRKSGIFSFPDGERLSNLELAGTSFSATEAGNHVIVRPVKGAAAGLYDLDSKKFVLGNGRSAFDGYGKVFVAERRDGEIGLFNIETKENIASVTLPPSPFGSLQAVSLGGNWLVASDRSRGAAWDLRTGERKMHVRGFRGAFVASDDKAYVDFPKRGQTERSVGIIDLSAGTLSSLGDMITDATVRQWGPYLVVQQAMKQEKPLSEKEKEEQEKAVNPFADDIRERPLPRKGVLFEMHDVRTGGMIWKREFKNERPSVRVNPVYGTMIIGWPLKSDGANEIIRADPELKAKRDKMGNKEDDVLLELVDPKSGAVKAHFFVETGKGSFSLENIRWVGPYIVITDDQNRILVYSVATGEIISRYFGDYPAVSPRSGTIAVENSPGRIAIYEIATGRELGRLAFKHPVSLMQFYTGGQRLIVLTRDQTVFIFDTSKFQPAG